MRQMHLCGFHRRAGEPQPRDLAEPRARRRLSRPRLLPGNRSTLERGKFDFVFFADRLGIADRYGLNLEVGIRLGDQDATRLDPVPILSDGRGDAPPGARRDAFHDVRPAYHVARELRHLIISRAAGPRGTWSRQ